MADWVIYATQKLVEHNHRLQDIGEYSTLQVMLLLAGIERIEANTRMAFVADMSAVVGGIFGGGDALSDHLNELQEVAKGG